MLLVVEGGSGDGREGDASREAERSAAKSTLLAGISCLDLPWHVRRSSEKGGIASLLFKGWMESRGWMHGYDPNLG
jgi:hypothetical protein